MSDYQKLVLSRSGFTRIMCRFCGCDIVSARGDEIKAYIEKIFKEVYE